MREARFEISSSLIQSVAIFSSPPLFGDEQTLVLDACAQIRERVAEIKGLGNPNQYGLFLHDEDPKKGVWLEPGRMLEHYLLRDNVSIAGGIHFGKCGHIIV